MKRILFSTALALSMGSMGSAQTITDHFDFGYRSVSFPVEFSYKGKPSLVLDDYNNFCYSIYDENLEKTKTIHHNYPSFDYQLQVRTEEREIKSVDEVSREVSQSWPSYDEFVQHEQMFSPSFTEDCLIFTDLENGDRRIDFDYSKLDGPYYNNMYFREDYFGKKYPYVYVIMHEGKVTMYSVRYDISFTEWEDKGIATENHSIELSPLDLVNVNLNTNEGIGRNYESFRLSQTLFNDDEGYEYLVPKYILVDDSKFSDGVFDQPSTSYGDIELIRSTVVSKASNIAMSGFQVVDENGKVLQDLTFDDYLGSRYVNNVYVVTIGSNRYLAITGRDSENKEVSVFYKIDKTASSIQKVRTLPGGMSLSSTIANKGADIQVNFSDGNDKGSEISVYSVNGAKVKSLMVPAGQKTATFNVKGTTGMYMVNRAQKGKANDTKKIIIK